MSTSITDARNLILRVIQDVFARTGEPLHRTQLVKLVYLTDYTYYQRAKRTFTGFRYKWDNFGPNALGNQIVILADVLAVEEKVDIDEELTAAGNFKFYYRPHPSSREPKLDELAEESLRDVLSSCATMDWKQVTERAKETRPFIAAKPGDILNLTNEKPSEEEVRAIREHIIKLGPPRQGKRVSLRELKARYGLG